mgnify:CR=1 FL=1
MPVTDRAFTSEKRVAPLRMQRWQHGPGEGPGSIADWVRDRGHTLSRTENTTILVVTHDSEIAGKTDRTFRLQDGKLKEEK